MTKRIFVTWKRAICLYGKGKDYNKKGFDLSLAGCISKASLWPLFAFSFPFLYLHSRLRFCMYNYFLFEHGPFAPPSLLPAFPTENEG
jgi:hypothetical protein